MIFFPVSFTVHCGNVFQRFSTQMDKNTILGQLFSSESLPPPGKYLEMNDVYICCVKKQYFSSVLKDTQAWYWLETKSHQFLGVIW